MKEEEKRQKIVKKREKNSLYNWHKLVYYIGPTYEERVIMEKPVNKMIVQRLLIHLGITPKSNGYRYLTQTVMTELSSRPRNIGMGRVCASVGAANGTTAAAVERCMRLAVLRAYDRNKLSGVNDLYNAYVITEAPTLSDFVMLIVEYLDSFYQYDDYTIG